MSLARAATTGLRRARITSAGKAPSPLGILRDAFFTGAAPESADLLSRDEVGNP